MEELWSRAQCQLLHLLLTGITSPIARLYAVQSSSVQPSQGRSTYNGQKLGRLRQHRPFPLVRGGVSKPLQCCLLSTSSTIMTTSLLNFRVRRSSEWRALDVSPKLLKTPRANDKVPGGLRRVGSETLSAELRTPAHAGFGAEETPAPKGVADGCHQTLLSPRNGH